MLFTLLMTENRFNDMRLDFAKTKMNIFFYASPLFLNIKLEISAKVVRCRHLYLFCPDSPN